MYNYLEHIKDEMKKHAVFARWPENSAAEKMILLEIHCDMDLQKEFFSAFAGKLQDLEEKVAKQIFSGKPEKAVYGILLDKSFNMRCAFNREFADYDRKSYDIVLKNPGNILAKRLFSNKVKKKKEKKGAVETIGVPSGKFMPVERHVGRCPGQIVLKYATPGPGQ